MKRPKPPIHLKTVREAQRMLEAIAPGMLTDAQLRAGRRLLLDEARKNPEATVPNRHDKRPKMGRPPKLDTPKQVAFRLPASLIARLERQLETARRGAPETTLTLSDVARELLGAALDRAERQGATRKG